MRRVDDVLKIFLGVCLSGIFALLGWLAVTISDSNLTMVEMNGKIELTNIKIGYLQKEISGLPRKEDLVTTNSKIDTLESRVNGLESWMAIWQRSIEPSRSN